MGKSLFFLLSPIFIFTVSGESMYPTLRSGEKILVVNRVFAHLQKDDVVVCLDPRTERLLVKRIQQKKMKKYFIVGDNKRKSTDSRKFGWILEEKIYGKVIYPQV